MTHLYVFEIKSLDIKISSYFLYSLFFQFSPQSQPKSFIDMNENLETPRSLHKIIEQESQDIGPSISGRTRKNISGKSAASNFPLFLNLIFFSSAFKGRLSATGIVNEEDVISERSEPLSAAFSSEK